MMNEKKQVKKLKITNAVVLAEVIVVVILLIMLLAVDWSGNDGADGSSYQQITEYSDLTDEDSACSEEEESSNSNTETTQDSETKNEQTETSNDLQNESSATGSEVGEIITEESENSPSQENWGEIDWD